MDNSILKRKDKELEVVISVTNNCNCKCKYCFENVERSKKITKDVQDRTIYLIDEFIGNKEKYQYKNLKLTFWGGEPMMNFDYVREIFEHSYKSEFVKYFLYTNGMVHDGFEKLVGLPFADSVKNRMQIQISYDGEPQNTELRTDSRKDVIDTFRLLRENKFSCFMKSTLDFPYISKFDEMWKSYYDLKDDIGFHVNFSPTLEMYDSREEYFDDWKEVLPKIFKLEYDYYVKNGSHLLWWIREKDKHICGINNTITVGVDGNIYYCQNNPFTPQPERKNKTIVTNIFDIDSFIEAYTVDIDYSKKSETCENCEAFFCNKCFMKTVDLDNIEKDWMNAPSRDTVRCNYFRYFGRMVKRFNFIKDITIGRKRLSSEEYEALKKDIYNEKCLLNFNNGFKSGNYSFSTVNSDNFDVKELFS